MLVLLAGSVCFALFVFARKGIGGTAPNPACGWTCCAARSFIELRRPLCRRQGSLGGFTIASLVRERLGLQGATGLATVTADPLPTPGTLAHTTRCPVYVASWV